MNFPFYIELWNEKIYFHTLFEIVAFFIGFRYFLFLRKKQKDAIIPSNRELIIVGAILGSLIGSRLLGALENPVELFSSKNMFMYIYSNKTVVGGFIGGLFGVELIKKIIHEKQSSGDLFTYPIILALIIGRIGCFSMGVFEETYGNATKFFTGMNLGDGLLRHPVTLYEIAFLILLWIALKKVEKNFSLVSGALFKIFMISYVAFRFFIDFIKPHYTFSIGLSAIQIACLLCLVYYYKTILHPTQLILKTNTYA